MQFGLWDYEDYELARGVRSTGVTNLMVLAAPSTGEQKNQPIVISLIFQGLG